MHRDGLLPGRQRRFAQQVDFLDAAIGHGVTADRNAFAVHHQVTAGALEAAVEGVGKADIEGQVIAAVGVQPLFGDTVEALGRLQVAFLAFRAELAGIAADRVGFEQREDIAVGDP